MNSNHNNHKGRMGKLPAAAPLANPYVPFQLEEPPMYEARQGIIRGTMYPGLDLPFMGRLNTKELNVTPKTELQTLAFAIQELALYLDTHRDDKQALQMYQAYQKLYHEFMMRYNEKCSPLNHHTPSQGEYRWLDDPWPWEYCANKEG